MTYNSCWQILFSDQITEPTEKEKAEFQQWVLKQQIKLRDDWMRRIDRQTQDIKQILEE